MNRLKMKEAIPLTYDFMFKEVFGSEKRISITTYFISKYLNINYQKLIGKVKLLNKSLVKDNIKDKAQEVDLIVETDNGIINIELNMRKYKYLIARNLSYLCRIYGNQLSKGDHYLTYKKALQINFDNFSLFKPNKVKRVYLFTSQDEDKMIYSDLIEIHHVDMEYCQKICYTKNNRTFIEEWVRLLQCKSMKEIRKVAGEVIMNDEVREEFITEIEELNNDPRLMGLYYDRKHHEEQVLLGAVELAKEEALEEGLKQGIIQGTKEGVKQGIIETAKKMLALGAETSFIKKATLLNEKELNNLLKEKDV